MRVQSLTVGPFAVSCHIVSGSEGGGNVLVIDPGGEPERILRVLRGAGLTPAIVVNTHGHGDHIGANAALKQAFPEAILAAHLSALFGYRAVSPPPDRLLADGDILKVGDLAFEVIHVPGHSPGGICLGRPAVDDEPPVLFTGDVLFAGSIGRTDFPGSDHELLLEGIRRRILTWPDETVVYPGHGPPTTIGRERRENPFIRW